MRRFVIRALVRKILVRILKVSPISVISVPSMAILEPGAAISSGFTAGVYTSTAGAVIASVTYFLNGEIVDGSATVDEGDTYSALERVTDTAGSSPVAYSTASIAIAPSVDPDALTFQGQPMTFQGQPMTFQSAA